MPLLKAGLKMDGQLPGPLSSFAVIVGEKEKKKKTLRKTKCISPLALVTSSGN